MVSHMNVCCPRREGAHQQYFRKILLEQSLVAHAYNLYIAYITCLTFLCSDWLCLYSMHKTEGKIPRLNLRPGKVIFALVKSNRHCDGLQYSYHIYLKRNSIEINGIPLLFSANKGIIICPMVTDVKVMI